MNLSFVQHTSFAIFIPVVMLFAVSSRAQEQAPYAELLPEDIIYFQLTEKVKED